MAKNDKKVSPIGEPGDRIKKIGDRKETITLTLTPSQIDDEKGKVCDLLARRDNIQAGLKSIKAEYKAKLDLVDEKIGAARRAQSDGFRDIEVDVEEWLTRGNEVVRVRRDTGEVIGRRTAEMEELQESMFEDPPRAASSDGFPSSEDAFGAIS